MLLRADRAMKSLSVRAWFALAILAAVMGLLLFVPAATVHYWQAWVYLSIFMGASALTTRYLLRKGPGPSRAPNERRPDRGEAAGSTAHHVGHVPRFHLSPGRVRS